MLWFASAVIQFMMLSAGSQASARRQSLQQAAAGMTIIISMIVGFSQTHSMPPSPLANLYSSVQDEISIQLGAFAKIAAGISSGCLKVPIIPNSLNYTLFMISQKEFNGKHCKLGGVQCYILHSLLRALQSF